MTEFRWNACDSKSAKKLTDVTSSPGMVFPIDASFLPNQIGKMAGVSSYYATGYTQPFSNAIGSIAGELMVARQDGDLTKNYNYVFAVNSAGDVYFCGPYKGFLHHAPVGRAVEISSLFGQSPYSKNVL